HGFVGSERRLESTRDAGLIEPVAGMRIPSMRGEARFLISDVGEQNRAIDRNRIVVPDQDELVELLASRKADGFVTDAFHQAAVAANHPGAVIDQIRTEPRRKVPLRDGHAHGIGDALSKRARRGLDPARVAVFRMACGLRTELPEALDLLERDLLVTREI